MLIAKKHVSRRTVLRGMDVRLALLLLDSMVPAQTPLRKTIATPRTRLACIEMVHGPLVQHGGRRRGAHL
jgi:hypothetical protein